MEDEVDFLLHGGVTGDVEVVRWCGHGGEGCVDVAHTNLKAN